MFKRGFLHIEKMPLMSVEAVHQFISQVHDVTLTAAAWCGHAATPGVFFVFVTNLIIADSARKR